MSFGLPLSYIITLIFGFPVYIFLKKNNYLSMLNLVASGVLLGAILFLLFIASVSRMLNTTEILQILFIGSIMGASVSYAFGKIAKIEKNIDNK